MTMENYIYQGRTKKYDMFSLRVCGLLGVQSIEVEVGGE